jgi:hypothetical protein
VAKEVLTRHPNKTEMKMIRIDPIQKILHPQKALAAKVIEVLQQTLLIQVEISGKVSLLLFRNCSIQLPTGRSTPSDYSKNTKETKL